MLGKIFGTDKMIEKTADLIRDGFDALTYTDEEKAEDVAKDRAAGRAVLVEWMQSMSGSRVARRYIAVVVTTTWIGQHIAAMLVAITAIFLPDRAAELHATSEIIGNHADQMLGGVMLIMGFYFAAPHLGRIVDVAVDKIAKKQKLKG